MINSILGPVGIDAGFPELYNPNAKVALGDGKDSDGNTIIPTPSGRHDLPASDGGNGGTIFIPTHPDAPIGDSTDTGGDPVIPTPTGRNDLPGNGGTGGGGSGGGTIFIPTNPDAPIGDGTDAGGQVVIFTPTGRVDVPDGTIFLPDTVLVTQREFIYLFYFININSNGIEPPLILGPDDYSDYNNFVSNGVLPLANQTIVVSDSTASVTVVKTKDQLELTIQITSRPLPSTVDDFYLIGRAEVWSRTLDSAGNIPASRRIDYINSNSSFGFRFIGGNPGNRSYPGVLQPNGFYKSIFNVNLPSIGSDSFISGDATFYQNAKIHPYSVPPSADIIVFP